MLAPGTSVLHGVNQTVLSQRRHPLIGPVKQLRRKLQILPKETVVHIHTCFSAFSEAAMHECRRKGLRYVFSPHGKLSPQMFARFGMAKRAWWFLFTKRLVESASVIGASSEEERYHLERIPLVGNFCSVSNGFVSQHAKAAKPTRGRPYLLFLGYLDPRKQPSLVIEAYALSGARKSHDLVLAGPDSYNHRSYLEGLVEKLGLRQVVEFYGPAYGEQKQALYENAAALCLPSKAEGQPLVLLESIGAGLPIIYSKACNASEFAAAGAGICLNDFLPKNWADAMDAVCLDLNRARLMRESCLQLAPQYSWPNIVKVWSEVYRGLY